MFLCDRGTILVLISLILAHLAATERREKFEEAHSDKSPSKPNRGSISVSENDRLRTVHDNDILKLIAGSSKSVRSKASSSDNRRSSLSASRDNNQGLDTSTSRKGNSVKTKEDTKKKSKSSNTRKSQRENVNLRKNKIKPIRGCSAGKKGDKKGYACRNPGRRVKRLVNIPGVEILGLWNATWVVPVPNWIWPTFWAGLVPGIWATIG